MVALCIFAIVQNMFDGKTSSGNPYDWWLKTKVSKVDFPIISHQPIQEVMGNANATQVPSVTPPAAPRQSTSPQEAGLKQVRTGCWMEHLASYLSYLKLSHLKLKLKQI